MQFAQLGLMNLDDAIDIADTMTQNGIVKLTDLRAKQRHQYQK